MHDAQREITVLSRLEAVSAVGDGQQVAGCPVRLVVPATRRTPSVQLQLAQNDIMCIIGVIAKFGESGAAIPSRER